MPDIFDPSHLIFLHGLEGTSQGTKATLLRSLFPEMLTPDFRGSLEERMATLNPILGDQDVWTIVGSSFGGLMAALFACQRPAQVRKLVLMAPALVLPQFAASPTRLGGYPHSHLPRPTGSDRAVGADPPV